MLPFVGLISPTDKIPLGNYIQDIEEMHKKTIDPITGRMFLKHTLQDDLRDKRLREKATVDRKQSEIGQKFADSEERVHEALRQRMVREMQLDESYAQFPTTLRREWAIAQGHLIQSTLTTPKEKAEMKDVGDQVSHKLGERVYSKLMKQLSKRQSPTENQMGNTLFEDLLTEKSLDYDKFKESKEQGAISKKLY